MSATDIVPTAPERPVSAWMGDTVRVPDTVTVADVGGPLAEQVSSPAGRPLPARCDGVLRLPDETPGAGPDLAIAPERELPGCNRVEDRAGRDLTGNPDVRVTDVEVLAAGWHVLRRTTFDYRHRDGHWSTQQAETYDRGNGATILLYDADRGTVLLCRQFRFPVYVNGHRDGMLIETAAGLLDQDAPATAIRREACEELGVTVGELQHVFDVYMSPSSVTQRLHFYAASYSATSRSGAGGGLAAEGEDIDVLELPFQQALAMITDGRIVDAKTIMLLQWAALRGPFQTP